MNPGEIFTIEGDLVLNKGSESVEVKVANTGDRPIQVGSHYHFAETNEASDFDRTITLGFRLDIPSGTAVRFEPGQIRAVSLIPFKGKREIYGFNGKVMGKI